MLAKGIVALDIDGTLITENGPVPNQVTSYLKGIVDLGWVIAVITGRTFSAGISALGKLPFPYYLAVQNGAVVVKMPERQIVEKKYIQSSAIASLAAACDGEATGCAIFGGVEYADRCYYCKEHFSDDILAYIERRRKIIDEQWCHLRSFDEIPFQAFPSVKCFGDEKSAFGIAKRIEKTLGYHAPVVRDPHQKGYFVTQVTLQAVSKGSALSHLRCSLEVEGPAIAAGDDLNDLSMFSEADISVAMATSPVQVRNHADIIAPSAEEMGIIKGIQEATG